MPDYKVGDVIDHDTRSRNMDIIDDFFDHSIKEVILSILLYPHATCDTVFWDRNKN